MSVNSDFTQRCLAKHINLFKLSNPCKVPLFKWNNNFAPLYLKCHVNLPVGTVVDE